ncbi:hypothetical protein P7L75_28245 [Tistrella mobilis]|uniref:hypothetical protein n=1 Tax=Tistrella mobilis TaxID=171437 RepID=UPI003558514C
MAGWDPEYRQVWEAHQARQAEAERAAQALREAEVARDLATGPEDRAAKAGEVDRLREEMVAARAAVSALELEVAQTHPERAEWLEAGIPPADGPVREGDPLVVVGHEVLSTAIEQAAHLDGPSMQVVGQAIEALPTPDEARLWAEAASTATVIEIASEHSGLAPGALTPEILAQTAPLVERMDDFAQNRDDILDEPAPSQPPEPTRIQDDGPAPTAPPPRSDLDQKHEMQRQALEEKLELHRDHQEARIARGEVRDADTLREKMEEAAARERQRLEERQAAERERAAREAMDRAAAEREAAARREAEARSALTR